MDACAPTTTSASSVPQVAAQPEHEHSSLSSCREDGKKDLLSMVTLKDFLLICRMTLYPRLCVQRRATGPSGATGAPVQPRCVTTLASRFATGNV